MFEISTKVACLQCYLVVVCLVPCKTVSYLDTFCVHHTTMPPHNYAPVDSGTQNHIHSSVSLLMPAGWFQCHHNPSNSDMDYRIVNMHMWSFCMCMHTVGTPVYSPIQRTWSTTRELQTHKRVNRMLFIRTKHNAWISRVIPFIKLQNDTSTTIKH